MITGHTNDAVTKELIESGCVCDVISKPWDHVRLIEAVKKCANSYQDGS